MIATTILCLLVLQPLQATNNLFAKQNTEKNSALTQADEERKWDHTPEITIPAEQQLIVNVLKKQMKDDGYRLIKQEADVLVFDRRTPGAAAAERRNSYNRTTMTPIIDDPRTIMAFGLTVKKKDTLVVARLMVTTVIQSQILQRDVTDKKMARITLNKVLDQLKTEIDKKGNANN